MWNEEQLALIRRYRLHAHLTDFEFRRFLYQLTGCNRPDGAFFTNQQFDDVIVVLEAELWRRVASGEVPTPGPSIQPDYWANRLPKAGLVNRRQAHEINRAFTELVELLPPDHPAVQDPKAYALGMARKASSRPDLRRLRDLRKAEAAALFEAVKDKIENIKPGDAA